MGRIKINSQNTTKASKTWVVIFFVLFVFMCSGFGNSVYTKIPKSALKAQSTNKSSQSNSADGENKSLPFSDEETEDDDDVNEIKIETTLSVLYQELLKESSYLVHHDELLIDAYTELTTPPPKV
jgi:hypothetical protein